MEKSVVLPVQPSDSISVSVDSLYRAYQILSHLNTEWGAAVDFFSSAAAVLQERWTLLQQVCSSQ